MEPTPSPTEPTGRCDDGRFGQGNRFSTGNPHSATVGKLRTALLDAITEDDMKAVILKLIDLAKSGNIAATKLLLDRCLGKPAVDQPLPPPPRPRPLGFDQRRRLLAITARIRAARSGTDIAGLPAAGSLEAKKAEALDRIERLAIAFAERAEKPA